jgi:16S rRNA G527 N7-methylase RsmG
VDGLLQLDGQRWRFLEPASVELGNSDGHMGNQRIETRQANLTAA